MEVAMVGEEAGKGVSALAQEGSIDDGEVSMRPSHTSRTGRHGDGQIRIVCCGMGETKRTSTTLGEHVLFDSKMQCRCACVKSEMLHIRILR